MPAPQPPAPGRRRFLKNVGIAGLTTTIAAPILSLAQTPAPPGAAAKPDSTAARRDSAAAAPAGPPEISEDARSLAEIVRRRYGRHLTPDQVEAIARDLDNRVRAGKTLRDAKLTNADEPDVTFHA
jgi:hypothetical protein